MHLQCAEQQASPSNLTKYCACHAKWLSWLICVTYGTSFTMRGATGITLQPHQILRLPRKSALQNLSEILRERLKRQFQCAADSTMIRTWSDHDPNMSSSSRTRPFAEVTFRASETHFVLKITTFRAPAIYPDFTEHCACHKKWHSKITKCCACHAKWLSWLICVTYETSFTMRRTTGITLQRHQILRLPRKMTLMIDLRHIWNVIYNARSNRHHPPTSPNTAPATQKCTPKSKRNSPRTVEASIPMRGRSEHDPTMIRTWTRHLAPARSPRFTFRASETHSIENYNISRSGYLLPRFHRILRLPQKVTLQDHQILRLPRKMSDSHDWCPSHMTRHLQCAEQQISSSNITKCCACHAKWLASSILVTYETLFTMRGATSITFQVHQMLRLPRKMTLMIDVRHIWNVISNARSNKHHPPTSPNTAPATQNCIPKSKRNCPRTVEVSIPMRGRFEHDPNPIRTWSEHELVISHPPVRRGYFSRFGDAFCIENYNISRSGYLPRFHRTLRLPQKVTLRHHQILRLPRKVTLRHHQMLRLPRKVTLRHHQILRLPRKVRLLLNCYWTELLLSCYWAVTKLLLSCYWTVTELLLNWYWTVTELLLNWPVTELLLSCYWTVSELLLNCYWTELLLDCHSTVTELTCYWAVTKLSCYSTAPGLLLNCYWTDLLLSCYWTVTELILDCHWTVTELSCYWTVTELNCYWTVTELLLNWAVTELLLNWTVTGLSLNCYWTDLLLNWAVTQLLLNWPVTELSCYSTVTGLLLNCSWTVTELTCYSAVTELLLNCYFALLLELLLSWTLCIFKCP